MKKWKLTKPKSTIFKNQLFVAGIVNEDGKKEDVLFYASNSPILNQIVEEHNKLIDIFSASKEKKIN